MNNIRVHFLSYSRLLLHHFLFSWRLCSPCTTGTSHVLVMTDEINFYHDHCPQKLISCCLSHQNNPRFVQHRNTKVVGAAARSNAIVSSLFPTAVRDRLMQQRENDSKTRNFRGFLADKSDHNLNPKELLFQTKPIADLFPETTIIFADIVNFTAWSSVRDPTQVFTLLETVYNAFDDIARKRRVFKVETIGDCYVAVCGLPPSQWPDLLEIACEKCGH
jgi:Adenylate and Guanylate cyclase catalytic domain